MELPNGAIVAVADGEQLLMFKNNGDEKAINLVNFSSPSVNGDNKSAGVRNQDSGSLSATAFVFDFNAGLRHD